MFYVRHKYSISPKNVNIKLCWTDGIIVIYLYIYVLFFAFVLYIYIFII